MLIDRLSEGYIKKYGKGELCYFTAPGRIELGGNHTDHQNGIVLAAAINLSADGAAAINGENVVRLYTKGYEAETVDLCDLSPREGEKGKSAALIRGVAAYIAKSGHKISGFNAYTESDIPGGFGLSSSAAFEVLVGNIFNHFFCGGAISAVDLAKAGQYAEREYFGKPCGLMDQAASSVGGIVSIDFESLSEPKIEKIQFDFEKNGYRVCVIATGGDHKNLTGEYASITDEMAAVSGFFGEKFLRFVDYEAFRKNLAKIREKAGDRAVLRAFHFFEENERAKDEADALKNGDVDSFLSLVKESGRSSVIHLQNVMKTGATREQPIPIALAACERIARGKGAFRVHGGGFAGTVLGFVPLGIYENFKTEIEQVTGKNSCTALEIRAKGGGKIDS